MRCWRERFLGCLREVLGMEVKGIAMVESGGIGAGFGTA